jgi:hypothetical protein
MADRKQTSLAALSVRRVLVGALLAVACGGEQASSPPPNQAAREAERLTTSRAAPVTATGPGPEDEQRVGPASDSAGPDAAERLLPDPGPRVGATQWFTWIHPKPDSRTMPLGYLRPGSTLALTDPTPVSGSGRCAKFVRVGPDGYVCVSRAGTLAVDSPYIKASRDVDPVEGAFPYEYALSVGTHMFTRVPTPEEIPRFGSGRRDLPLRGWEATHDELAVEEPIVENGTVPEFLRDGGYAPMPWGKPGGLYFKKVPRGAMIAYTRAFRVHGEVWVLATNLTVVPARGLKRFRRSSFRGVELGSGVELPLAWVRRGSPAKWRRDGERVVETGERWALRSYVPLTGAERTDGGEKLLETRDGSFVRAAEVSVAKARRPPRALSSPDEKWVHAELRAGLLTLYRGPKPVFVTLSSPGVENATPEGLERVESKHHVSTLTTENGEPKKFWIADVPWVIYFRRPFAIHTAFWHEDFGEPRSYGCLNVSPMDGQRIFEFVDPPLPDGWGSVQGDTRMGRGTIILIER